jgi:hypothetical protein
VSRAKDVDQAAAQNMIGEHLSSGVNLAVMRFGKLCQPLQDEIDDRQLGVLNRPSNDFRHRGFLSKFD